MRYIIFSDIHGNGLSFLSFLDDIQSLEYDRVIFLGDFVGYYYDAERIIEYCMANDIHCLLGNHDSYFLQVLDGCLDVNALVAKYGNSYALAKQNMSCKSIEFLRTLLPFCIDEVDGLGKILFCHGSPKDYFEGRIYPDTPLEQFSELVDEFRYVVCGHTHHKMIRANNNTVFLNPGSLGQQRDGKGCSYILFDTNTQECLFKTVEYDVEALELLIDKFDGADSRLKNVLRRRS